MLKSAKDFRLSPRDWNDAKEQARAAMIERAKVRGAIPYSDLVKKIKAMSESRFSGCDRF